MIANVIKNGGKLYFHYFLIKIKKYDYYNVVRFKITYGKVQIIKSNLK